MSKKAPFIARTATRSRSRDVKRLWKKARREKHETPLDTLKLWAHYAAQQPNDQGALIRDWFAAKRGEQA